MIREPTITESHNTMLNLSSCSGNYWLYVLLIVLGGVTPGLAGVVRAQAQTPPSAPQADPDNTEHVALGQQVYASFCTGCHGANLEGQPNWQKKLPLGNFPAPPPDETGHTWHHADQWLCEISSMMADTSLLHEGRHAQAKSSITWRALPC